MPQIRPAPPRCFVILAGVALLTAVAPLRAPAIAAPLVDEDRGMPPGPVDYGYGPNVRPSLAARTTRALRTAAAELVARIGGSYAHIEGAFGPAVPWRATRAIAAPEPGRA